MMKLLSLNRLIVTLAALMALGSGLALLSTGAVDTDGTRTLALDDSYIHLQYSWQAAQGRWLQYNDGEAPSSGATSLLYLLLLAGGFALGISRTAMPEVVIGLGLALYPLAAALLADLTRRAVEALYARRGPLDDSPPPHFPPWNAGLLAGLIFGSSGWMAWAYLSGMETGLLLTLIVGTLWAFQTGRVRLTALLGALAVLTRPEVVLLAGLLLLAQAILDPAETNDRRRRFLWGCVPVSAVIVAPLFYLAVTGSPSSSGLLAKSWLTLQPFYPDRVLLTILGTALDLLLRVLNLPAPDGLWHAFPLALAFGLVGALALAARGRVREKRLALAALGWVIVGAAATATLQPATWHHYRYQMPLYPALVLLLSAGLAVLANEIALRLAGRGLPGRLITISGLLIVAAWSLFTLADFRAQYALDTATTASQQIVLADWLRANTADDTLIAVHDVGVMRYRGERATYDVVGLTTAGMAAVARHGPGAIYERLETVQPDYYAVYPGAAPPYYGIDVAPTLLGKEVFRVTLEAWSRYTSAQDTQVVTRPDWSGVPLAAAPQQPHLLDRLDGWVLADTLDVADLDSESAHDYAWWHAARPEGFLTLPLVMAYHDAPGLIVTDAVRILTGGESFTARTPQTGEWALLVARLHQTHDMAVRVYVNGDDAGLWKLPALPGEWLESAFLIRADLVRGPRTAIRLMVEDAPPEARLSAAHFWLYQGEPQLLPPPPGTISGAAFDDVARLRGYDLPGRVYAPGETLSLTLHWEAIAPYRADHRVFVHLIDPENDTAEGILAQADSAPRGGTSPFWVWAGHEAVSDTITLTIPPDAHTGDYLLLVGIYDGATLERLPIIGGDDFGASRLILGPITIR